jgi:anti-anti-sigma factor
MEITVKEVEGFTVVELNGSFDTRTSPDVQSELTRLIEQEVKKVVINMEQVEYISSSGLRALLFITKQLIGINGELRLCCLNETVREVFAISGFDTILKVYASEEEAMSR